MRTVCFVQFVGAHIAEAGWWHGEREHAATPRIVPHRRAGFVARAPPRCQNRLTPSPAPLATEFAMEERSDSMAGQRLAIPGPPARPEPGEAP
jgi:hypothetical protein